MLRLASKTFWMLAMLLVAMGGCIGTDFLEETVEFVEPYITIDPLVEAVEIGSTITYSATYFDSTDMPVSVAFEWSSTDESVASITADGVAQGDGVGQTRITASAHGIVSENALLTVVADPASVARVDIIPTDTSVTEGDSFQFDAAVFNGNNELLEDRTIEWRVSPDTLATVDATGLVKTSKPGTLEVTATADGVDSVPAILEIYAMMRTGTFVPRPGTSYDVSGGAVLEQVEPGRIQLRFEDDFESSNGPDLYVYLSTTNQVNAMALQVAQLQSTSGEQAYDLPSYVRMNDFNYVIIHCLPFNVTFGYARLN